MAAKKKRAKKTATPKSGRTVPRAKLKPAAKKKGVINRAAAAVKGAVKRTVTKLATRKGAKKKKAPRTSPNADLTIEQWVAKKVPAEQVPLASAILTLVAEAVPQAKGCIKWDQPVFEHHGGFAYFRPAKEHVTFGFFKGQQLSDPNGLLQGDGARMKHIKLKDLESFPRDALKQFVQQAAQLNEKEAAAQDRGEK